MNTLHPDRSSWESHILTLMEIQTSRYQARNSSEKAAQEAPGEDIFASDKIAVVEAPFKIRMMDAILTMKIEE